MAKYHIKPDGTLGHCHAQPGNCPYGGEDIHFDNLREAQAEADRRLEEEFMEKTEERPVIMEVDHPGYVQSRYKQFAVSGPGFAEITTKITSTVPKEELEQNLMLVNADLKNLGETIRYKSDIFSDFPQSTQRRVEEDLPLKTKKDYEAKAIKDEIDTASENRRQLYRLDENLKSYLRNYDKKKVSSEELQKDLKEFGYEIYDMTGYNADVERYPHFKSNRDDFTPELTIQAPDNYYENNPDVKVKIQTVAYGALDREEIEKVRDGFDRAIKASEYLESIDWTAVKPIYRED